jgi:hypothetical protein
MESLKHFNRVPPSYHGTIMSNGDYLDDFLNFVDNIRNHLR